MVIFILFCFLLTACSTVSKDESVSISFMHGWGGSGFDHVGMRELFAEFEALNPDVHIVRLCSIRDGRVDLIGDTRHMQKTTVFRITCMTGTPLQHIQYLLPRNCLQARYMSLQVL